MSLFERIRSSSDKTIMQVVFIAIVVVFIFWGYGRGSMGGDQSVVLATVNKQRITDNARFAQLYRSATADMQGADDDQLRAVQKQVVEQLVREELMRQEATRLGIQVDQSEIIHAIANDTSFHDSEGRFSKDIYDRVLARARLTPTQHQEILRKDIMQRRLIELVASAARVSEVAMRERFELESASLTLRWVKVPYSNLLTGVPVEESAIDAFVQSRPEELQKAYDGELNSRYNRPARAELATILMRSDLDQGRVDEAALRAKMDAVLARARAGEDFAKLAAEWSEDLTASTGGYLGQMASTQLDPAVAPVVTSAAPGTVTDIIQTTRGLQIFKVIAVEPAVVIPLEQAKREIARELIAREGVQKFAADFADSLLARWKAEGQPPADMMARYVLSAETSPPFPPARPSLLGAGESLELQTAISAARTPGVLPLAYKGQDGLLLAEVLSYTPGDADQYKQMQPLLRARLEMSGKQELVQRWLKDLEKRSAVVYTPMGQGS